MKQTFSIILKPGKEKAISNRHPWIFSGAIAKKSPGLVEGDLVQVLDGQGNSLAQAYFCADSGIACRIITFAAHEKIDAAFFKARFHAALAQRLQFLLPSPKTTGFRLIFSEADGLSGLICDVFGAAASIELNNPGLKDAVSLLADFLGEHLGVEHICLHDAAKKENRFIKGDAASHSFLENGLTFNVDIESGQKTGHFLDQRENREMVRHYAKNRRVLDSFCYSGGFSVYALAGQAAAVTSVDIAQKAIDLCKKNVLANGFTAGHEAVVADCFDYVRTIKPHVFDMIILDPPAFAKSLAAVDRAARGYKDINLVAMKAIKPAGLLFTFSCSQHIDEDLFQKIVFAAAKDAGRDVVIVKKLSQGVDHPVSLYCPQSFYLKGLLLYVR